MKWITRKDIKVDRVACPWLIRRFIDPEAQFVFVPKSELLATASSGFLVAGLSGAVAAAVGVFLPVYVVVVLVAPYYRRFSENPQLHAFVRGVTSAARGNSRRRHRARA